MLGAIIGDIIGSRWEFNRTNDYNFELFSEENNYTDDTICTIAVADALLHNSDDYGKYIHEWCRRYPRPMGGYGGRFAMWVMSNNPKPYGSFGNGSAMRVSPIGWWFANVDEISAEAEKTAVCTHNHKEGIIGAQAVALAIYDAIEIRKMFGENLTEEIVSKFALYHGIELYEKFPINFRIEIEKYRNIFDETCQGTVPVALWIVLHSNSFEDAIRQAVSLGADADTIGAIVGSIAEALWEIPEWMKEKAMSYLPDEMKTVVKEFQQRTKKLRKLTKRCQFYTFDKYYVLSEENKVAYEIERTWAHDLAKSYTYADAIKADMVKCFPMNDWQDVADNYDLPVSLIGYIAKTILTPKHKSLKVVVKFLENHYAARKEIAAKLKEEKEQKEGFIAIMRWKLGLGNFNNLLFGKDPIPDKSRTATASDLNIKAMPDNDNEISNISADYKISAEVMEILRKGHIPEAQEDHWFMYCDEEYIRYYRSWTGTCAFEAHYKKDGIDYIIDNIKINRQLVEFGVNGDEAGIALFKYLITAESGGDAEMAWKHYIKVWEYLDNKYSNKK